MTSLRTKSDVGYIIFDEENPLKYYVNPFPRSSRGRGKNLDDGIPLLPIGLWDALYHGIDKNDNENSNNNTADTTENNDDDDEIINEIGDWKCSNCENVNWSWRPKCNKCNHEKPLHLFMKHRKKSGEITNLNENLAQDRASSSVVEVAEDGFDDFGRRIKKNKVDKKAKEEAALARLNSSYATVLNPLAALEMLKKKQPSQPNTNTNSNSNNSTNNKSNGQFDNADSSVSRKTNMDIKHDYNRDRNGDTSRDPRHNNNRGRNRGNSRDRDSRCGDGRDRYRENSRDRDRRR